MVRGPVVVRLKDAAQAPHANRARSSWCRAPSSSPHEFEHLAVHVPVAFPSVAERAAIVDDTIAQFAATSGPPARRPQARDLLGPTARWAVPQRRRAARARAVVDDGAITVRDVPVVERARFDALAADGVLSYEYATVGPGDVVGLDRMMQ
ncbi:hypothetical protein ACFP82_00030 [Cellulomonas gelida]|uniref:hypothetical protein n=1 Tax=Cellulomonas gelida TaxID=1712 RepID=UPI00360E0125